MWWQAEFLQYTYARAGMKDKLTALVSNSSGPLRGFTCSAIPVSTYTHCTGSSPYPPLNKPGAIAEWAKRESQSNELVLIVDPDSAFIGPIREPAHLPRGEACAQPHDYLSADLPSSRTVLQRHCSGKLHAGVQPVGIYILINRADLAVLAPRWLQKALEIKSDATCRQALPDDGWISEMWAYAIAAAELGIRHRLVNYAQPTGSNTLTAPIIHYCFPIMPRHEQSWRPGAREILWSKWTYRPWEVPLQSSHATVEGQTLLRHLADFATLKRASTSP